MTKNFTALQLLLLSFIFFIHGHVSAQSSLIVKTPCTLPDLVFENIQIQNVSQHNVLFDFTVKNAGGDTLYLNRMYFQAYFSKDGVYDNSDIPAGGSIFGTSLLPLAHGETYNRSWNSYTSADLSQYKYVIVQVNVLYNQSMPECSTTNNTTSAYFGCTLSDLVVDNITITNVSGNIVNFNFTIRNSGWAPLPISKMYYQAYVSKDAVYDGTDQPAGGSNLNTNLPDLLHDQTYTGSWTSYPFVSITEYPYIILQFNPQYGKVVPECNTANNVGSAYIGCNLAELSITNLVINSVIGNNVTFTYTIKNTGWDKLYLNRMYLKTYTSLSPTSGFFSLPAGEGIIGEDAPVLAKDEEYTGTWTSTASGSLSFYKYLIVQFTTRPGATMPECNYGNNSTYKYINPFNFAIKTTELSSNALMKISVDQANKTLTIGDASDDSPVTYNVYSVDSRFNGHALLNGSTTGSKGIDLNSLRPGLYIIQLSNGGESYTEKFMIFE